MRLLRNDYFKSCVFQIHLKDENEFTSHFQKRRKRKIEEKKMDSKE